jgi:hypothetical protein
MLAVVPEGPLQVYKKKNEVMAVSKEPTRKLKMKKSKSKGKKVHLFRDGFTLPSAEEQEDDSDSGVVGMAHGDWSGQVLSSLTSELLAEFPVSDILPFFTPAQAVVLCFSLNQRRHLWLSFI